MGTLLLLPDGKGLTKRGQWASALASKDMALEEPSSALGVCSDGRRIPCIRQTLILPLTPVLQAPTCSSLSEKIASQTDTQQILLKGKIFIYLFIYYGEGGLALEQLAQRGYRVFILGGIQNQAGHDPVQPGVADPV